MFKFNKIYFITILILLIGCSTTSMEFRSAKSAARAEKNLQRGEEWALKALDIEPGNALIPYFLATEIYKPQERWDEMANMLNEAEKRNTPGSSKMRNASKNKVPKKLYKRKKTGFGIPHKDYLQKISNHKIKYSHPLKDWSLFSYNKI